ncbi:hypothetical protein MJO47_07565 [Desulfuromonas sp. KJ2020]|uniref:PCYCGC motif-containing (lipo)protein n=1 Tax=Desulfuromonas sp. KJ2020 TaxID=2919173 RepID=UPI0020A6DCEE|nr:PCYCGC motif-containing (lipo)protein [Desulfuromonas sp. KJ2020]MCP3176960.1 hypothetical protein [Desulfuromonas sp. KJ2020]
MKTNIFRLTSIMATVLVFLLAAGHVFAGDDQEFNRILNLGMADLTQESLALLDSKYPDEDWDAVKFPQYVFTSDSVEAGYMIAVKEPELLKKFKCYCFCDTMGHADLSWCFLKKGKLKKGFDDHGSDCNICYGQAMMALLWQEAGFSAERMTLGFEKKFAKLIEQFGNK